MGNSSRFSFPVKGSDYNEAAKGIVPANTKKSINWPVRVFESWVNECSVKKPEDPIPENILECHDHGVLCKHVRYFVLHLRKEDGTPYPPSSIRSILSGLNRALKENGVPFSMKNKEDLAFLELFFTLDMVNASVISYEHEAMFWEKKLPGYDTLKSLQMAVFLGGWTKFCPAWSRRTTQSSTQTVQVIF